MKKNKNWLLLILGLVALLGFGQAAQATLSAVGPVDPADGFPVWYQDANSLALIPCHSTTQSLLLPGNLMCVLLADPSFNPLLPVVFPTNYPQEAFYWIVDADTVTATNPFSTYVKSARFGLEKTFAGIPPVPVNGQQTVFARIRFRVDPPVAGTYTITHPFGSKTYPNAPAGVKGINDTVDVPLGTPLDFTSALNDGIGPFLRWDTGYPIVIGNERFIGDPNVAHLVTGSPTGNNFVRVDGPPNAFGPGVSSIQTNLFFVAGKIFNGTLPTPLTVTQATYTRTNANPSVGQVDIFATSSPLASVTVNANGVIPAWPMIGDGTGKFFAHIPIADATTLPATITVTADDSANNPANAATTSPPVNLTDLVTISLANYDIAAVGVETLTIAATSSDALAPVPTLTSSLTGGVFSLVTKAPPSTVTVTSSKGGSDTQKVTVLTPGVEPALPPVARNDAARSPGTPVIISVLTNDMAPGSTLDPATVTVVAAPGGGTATANQAVGPNQGTITYTPGGFVGTTTFTYTVKNALNATSNIATVTVTVAAAPVAVNDGPITTAPSTPIVINILANDTAAAGLVLNTSSVLIGTAPLHGTTSINLGTGAVTYTSAAGYSGPDSFTYTVKDNLGTISNAATVSITVIVPGTPTAVNDSAVTVQGQAVIIPVLANDLGALNFTTLVVASPPIQGSAVVNTLNGSITYTPPVAFTGQVTFTYTVRSTLGIISNPATVTVTVTPLVETNTVSKAEFNSRLRSWTVTGRTTAVSPPNNTMTIRTGLVAGAGTLLGTAAVDTGGNWALNLANSAIPFDANVNVKSSYGTAVTSAVRLR